MKPLKQRDSKRRLAQGKWKSKLYVEYLEDRVMLDATVIEDFSAGLDPYRSIYKFFPSADIVPGAAHDGMSNALVKHDGYEWMVRNDDAVQVQRGETISVWTKFADNVDGRIYFGFGATPDGLVHSPLSDGKTLALVLAGNTSQLMFQGNDTASGFKPAPRTLGTPVGQSYVADQWYYVQVVWGNDGTMTGNLYDDMGNLLNSVTASGSTLDHGGISFRGFGSDKYFDTVSVDNGGAPGPGHGTHFFTHHVFSPSVPTHSFKANPQPHPLSAGITGGDGTGTPVPWDYTSVPGTGRDVQLNAWANLTQVPNTFGIIPGLVALAGQNTSFINGSVQITWGPDHYNGGTSDINPETPYLAQYMFRQLPGEATQLIGSSDIKHFFSSAHADYQHLNPGESDTYGSSLNYNQDDMIPGSDMDPVTGDIHRFTYFSQGDTDVNGFNPNHSRTYSSRLQHLLQVHIADLDPSQNPAGTRWYFMGCLWVAGDDNVDNNSRWVEVVPTLNGSQFSFTYPQGSGGQLNFRSIPGLVGNSPSVISQSPSGNVAGPVDHVRFTFSEAINPDTFGVGQVHSFNGPGGPIPINSGAPVDNTNTVFDVSFDPQSAVGTYTMTIGPDIYDMSGNPMTAPYTARFNVIQPGALVNGGFETGDFTGWTLRGDLTFVNVNSVRPHTGRYAAELGPVGSMSFISQTVATSPGQSYRLSYWLNHQGGGVPNEFQVSIGGTVVFDQLNMGSFAYTQYSFDFMATGGATTIQFGAREDPAYFYLDDVDLQSLGGSPGVPAGSGSQNLRIGEVGLAAALGTPARLSVPAVTGSTISPATVSLATDPSKALLDQVFAAPIRNVEPSSTQAATEATVPALDPFDPVMDPHNLLLA